jgi:hypothetical protein
MNNRGNILQPPVVVTTGSILDIAGHLAGQKWQVDYYRQILGRDSAGADPQVISLSIYDTVGDDDKTKLLAEWANRHVVTENSDFYKNFMQVLVDVEARIDAIKDPARFKQFSEGLMVFDSISNMEPDLRFSKKGQRCYDRPIFASRSERIPHMQRSGQRLRKGPK